jgi:O-antigen/teichoic acid export membrane protein
MGWFGLSNLLDGYESKGVIWMAFGLMQCSSLLVFIFQRYQVALTGMNYVALNNRWGIIFSLLSVAFGSLTLWMGGGIIALVLVMQFLAVAGVLRNRFLLRAVEGGRVLRFKQYGFDREVFGWAWAPTWKGFVGQFGMNGSAQLTAIIYTAYGSKMEIASLLFALRILQTITQIAQAPFSSVQPLMARLMAAGDIKALGKIVRQRMAYTLVLTAAGVLTAAVALPILLELIGSKIDFIPSVAWLLLGGLSLIVRFDVLCCAVSAIGNQMVFYWGMAAAAAISAGALLLLGNAWGVYTSIITSTIPLLLILNLRPALLARSILKSDSN